jgi:trk system potassium uptake protein TrkA
MSEVYVHPGWIGSRMGTLETASRTRVAYLTRLGEGIIPTADTVYQEGDLVHLVMRHDDDARVEAIFSKAPVKEEH